MLIDERVLSLAMLMARITATPKIIPSAVKNVRVLRDHKLRKGKEEIIKISVDSVKQALAYTSDVEFSPEDASRTELEFLEEITQAVIEAGATTVNLPDTVGYATPKGYVPYRINPTTKHILTRVMHRGFETHRHHTYK